ncbi:hypothetical protein VOLCADRAFT_37858, partial [Volvox carteri f. nagariensis]
VVFVGHHQSGKSTAAGHILVKFGGLEKRILMRVERETSNRPTSRYAWVLDRSRLERDRSMTLDLKLNRNGGNTDVVLTLIDTPGHRDYLRSTIAGITQA